MEAGEITIFSSPLRVSVASPKLLEDKGMLQFSLVVSGANSGRQVFRIMGWRVSQGMILAPVSGTRKGFSYKILECAPELIETLESCIYQWKSLYPGVQFPIPGSAKALREELSSKSIPPPQVSTSANWS